MLPYKILAYTTHGTINNKFKNLRTINLKYHLHHGMRNLN